MSSILPNDVYDSMNPMDPTSKLYDPRLLEGKKVETVPEVSTPQTSIVDPHANIADPHPSIDVAKDKVENSTDNVNLSSLPNIPNIPLSNLIPNSDSDLERVQKQLRMFARGQGNVNSIEG